MAIESNYLRGDRITPDRDVVEGDILEDSSGALWMAKVKRGTTVPVFPFVNGHPEVHAEALRRIDLNENTLIHTGENYYGYAGQPFPSRHRAAPRWVSGQY